MLSRRRFFGTVARAGAAAAVAPYFIPARALGRDGAVAPSERIVMAGIGIGRRGAFDLNWALNEPDTQFVAICDVDKESRDNVAATINAKNGNADCKKYIDVRDFLAERPDIDAVLIATSERWHALMAILAMKAGKDVYCEKPGSMTIAEARALSDTARRYGRVYQTGTQRRSEGPFVYAVELARSGRLGKLQTVTAHTLPDVLTHEWLPAEPEPSKDVLDWDLWLGPVPWRPYNKRYIHGWHGYYDFHTGGVGEWGSHTINHCHWAAGADDTSPVEYLFPNNSNGDGLTARFANGITLKLNAEGWPRGAGGMWRGSCGVRFDGTEGWVSCADGYPLPEVSSRNLLIDYQKTLAEYQERTQRPLNHMRDFLNCVKTRRQTVANAEVSHRTMTSCHAANICLWLGRDLKWDPSAEQFVGDAEANRMRSRAMREPWTL